MSEAIKVAAICTFLAVAAFSCGMYNTEAERQQTERMRLCVQSGGKIVSTWARGEKCEAKP
jgi:hypothetical protein